MSDFVSFARSYGLTLDYAVSDGRWHRVPTEDHPRKKNGAYRYDGDVGFVQNHATMAEVAMWKDGTRASFMDKAAVRARLAISETMMKARHAEAAAKAEDMVKRAVLMAHPYLAAKGFPDERGLVLDDNLLVPMREFRNYSTINSLQRIRADGSKLFLPGGKASGSVFLIGSFMAAERWLVEGYATGLSVRAALRELHREAQVVVCFSAGNLSHIGKLAKGMRPRAYVFADHDESGAGARAAADTGLSFVMTAEFGDANDYHQRHGVRALAKLIRTGSAEVVRERASAG